MPLLLIIPVGNRKFVAGRVYSIRILSPNPARLMINDESPVTSSYA